MVIGEDYSRLKLFSFLNSKEVPYVSILVQSSLALVYLLTATFESLIVYVGFVITLFSFLTVLGLFFIGKKDSSQLATFKSFGYPLVPAVYLLFQSLDTCLRPDL